MKLAYGHKFRQGIRRMRGRARMRLSGYKRGIRSFLPARGRAGPFQYTGSRIYSRGPGFRVRGRYRKYK